MTKIKTAHLGLGLDLLGSQTSLQAGKRTGNSIELWWETGPSGQEACLGLKTTSGKNGRQVCVPWANLKGLELDVPTFDIRSRQDAFPRNTPATAGVSAAPRAVSVHDEPSEVVPQTDPEDIDPIIAQALKAKKAAPKRAAKKNDADAIK